jgi:NAD(P)-dependent dehydrogenase (short-subunit alcohol dehydrogenase family)
MGEMHHMPAEGFSGRLPPVLSGQKSLVVGVANDRSIAWGCAQAMRRAGAEIAMTYLNEKARSYVEPLARAVEAPLFMPLEVRDPAQADALFEAIAARCAETSAGGEGRRLSSRRVPDRDGSFLLVVPRSLAPGGEIDGGRRNHDHHELPRRERGH